MHRAPAWSKWCPRSAPAPPQGAPGSCGWFGTPRGEAGPLGVQPLPRVLERTPPNPPTSPPVTMQPPAVTFGAMYSKLTNYWIGPVEMIAATAWCGILYSLVGGQPMMINGGTGPVLAFTAVLHNPDPDTDPSPILTRARALTPTPTPTPTPTVTRCSTTCPRHSRCPSSPSMRGRGSGWACTWCSPRCSASTSTSCTALALPTRSSPHSYRSSLTLRTLRTLKTL